MSILQGVSDVLSGMGNQISGSLQDGGVEPLRATLFDDDHRTYSSEDEEYGEVRVDLESGRRSMTERVDITPEDTAMGIYNMLRDFYPKGVPICKQMLYFSMMYTKEETNETDIALGSVFVDDDDDDLEIECYWLMNSHVYVDILRHNKVRLGVDPIYESVTADDLQFVCIQKIHMDKCVDLFWEKFIAMKLDIFQPHTNGINQEDQVYTPVVAVGQMENVVLYEEGYDNDPDPINKKDE